MHGRPRNPSKPVDEAASAAKAEKLRLLQSQFLSYHHQKIYTKEAIELSAKLVESNPECYTAWNFRKLAVEYNLTQSDSDPSYVKSILDEELRVVERALRQNFKSYGAWYHRKWVLSKGHSSLEKELRLLEEFQRSDPRNFHAWSYRRFVAALVNRSDEDELDHTTNMIEATISNYSAWHNRSVLLSNLLKKNVERFSKKDEVITEEFELVRQALFTDPDDQSGWFYHRWLLQQTVKNEAPLLVSSWPTNGSDLILSGDRSPESYASFPLNKFQFCSGRFPLILYFNQMVEGVNSSAVAVSGFNSNDTLMWNPLSTNSSKAAQVWVTWFSFPDPDPHSSEEYHINVTVGHHQGIISSSGFHFKNISDFAFKVCVQPVKTEHVEGVVTEKISWIDENFLLCEPHFVESNLLPLLDHSSIKDEHETVATTWQANIIAEEIQNFRELSDCKLGKLTLARLLTAHDALFGSRKLPNAEEVLRLYKELMKLDPSHYQYYKDEYSLVLLEQLMSKTESVLSHYFHYSDPTSLRRGYPICLRLHKLSLSRVGSIEKLLWVQMLDLSQNELKSIEGLEALQLLSHLSLSKNKLSSFTALEPLRHLKSLEVLDISHNEIGAHAIDTTRYLCSSPLSHSTGSEWEQEKIGIDVVDLTNYWEAFSVLKGLNLIQLDVVGNAISDEKFTLFLTKILPKLKWVDGIQLD